MGGEVMVDLRLHSLKAYYDNMESHLGKDAKTYQLIVKMGEHGLNAAELDSATGWGEHKSCGSALARVKRKHDDIEYRPEKGKKHGRYYSKPKKNKFWSGEQ
jgi:hypothetical protein